MNPGELNPGIEKLRDDARGVFQAAVEEADPALAVERAGGFLRQGGLLDGQGD